LYWSPLGSSAASRHISALKGLTDYLADELGTVHLNPLVTACTHDQRLIYAAWHRRTHNDFLGHISNKSAGSVATTARSVRGTRRLSRLDDDSVAFPESLFEIFYLDGFGKAKDRRCAVRDQLILLLLHGGGARESEALHLWVQDVLIDPVKYNNCVVRIYHPEDGIAPDKWKSRTGKKNRSAYLREKYGLTSRTRLSGSKRVGWKARLVDHPDNFIQLHWFPSQFGVLFLQLWREHVLYLSAVERHHPYAFVSYEKKYIGQPYKLSAFNENYKSALARIGYSNSKSEGRSPHGHRHAFGRRLTRAGVDPIIRKKALHHTKLESQVRYTTLSIKDVSSAMQEAERQLSDPSHSVQENPSFSDWDSIIQNGFHDVDPQALMSGSHPKLRGY
jgi:integrase